MTFQIDMNSKVIFIIQYAFTVNGNVSDYCLVYICCKLNEINICHLQK